MGKVPIILQEKRGDVEEEEESGGRGARDEQSPWSVYLQCCCFCSEHTLMDTHTHTYTVGQTLTHLHNRQLVGQVLLSGSAMNNVSLLLRRVTVSLVSQLFQYEEENPSGPAFCCSLRSGVRLKGRPRGGERGRESGRERICPAVLVRV